MNDVGSVAEALGHRIRDLRRAKQWTQMRLAAEAGINSTWLTEIERGKRNPTLKTLVGIANALDVPIVVLFINSEKSV